jgi:hypothetical protein
MDGPKRWKTSAHGPNGHLTLDRGARPVLTRAFDSGTRQTRSVGAGADFSQARYVASAPSDKGHYSPPARDHKFKLAPERKPTRHRFSIVTRGPSGPPASSPWYLPPNTPRQNAFGWPGQSSPRRRGNRPQAPESRSRTPGTLTARLARLPPRLHLPPLRTRPVPRRCGYPPRFVIAGFRTYDFAALRPSVFTDPKICTPADRGRTPG